MDPVCEGRERDVERNVLEELRKEEIPFVLFISRGIVIVMQKYKIGDISLGSDGIVFKIHLFAVL